MRNVSAAFRVTDEDGEFAVSLLQLASAQDPHCNVRQLIEQSPEAKPASRVGRPYHVWRDNLELARSINDRLASDAPD